MGIPKFANLIREQYPSCWNYAGRMKMDEGGYMNTKQGKRIKFRNLLVDGNSLLHPSFQYAFGYGGIPMSRSQMEHIMKSPRDVLMQDAVGYFCNAIENMIETLNLQGDVYIVFDGSAPAAKMIQQRQRRFGSHSSPMEDKYIQEEITKERTEIAALAGNENIRKPTREDEPVEEGAKIHPNENEHRQKSVVIHLQPMLSDPFASRFPGGKRYLQTLAGGNEEYILKNLIEWSRTAPGLSNDGVRWVNVLHPRAPFVFQYKGKNFMSLYQAMIYNLYESVVGKSDPRMESMLVPNNMVKDMEARYQHYFSNGQSSSNMAALGNTDGERTANYFESYYHKIMLREQDTIHKLMEEIGMELAMQKSLFRETLIRTGESILMANDNTLHWLMNIRRRVISNLSRLSTLMETDTERYLRKLISDKYSNVDMDSVHRSRNVESDDVQLSIYYEEDTTRIQTDSKFDSNALTPGTNVMFYVENEVRKHYRGNVYETTRGQRVRVNFSGSDLNGEGEQKLMKLFRDKKFSTMKTNDLVDVYYGLDADLFILTLIRSNDNGYHPGLLREDSFGVKTFQGVSSDFNYHDEVRRHGLIYHFVDIDDLAKQLTTESRIHPHDFAVMTFMFGNDFLPKSPSVGYDSINRSETSPFHELCRVYSEKFTDISRPVLVERGDNMSCHIRWENLLVLLSNLSMIESRVFSGMMESMKHEKNLRVAYYKKNGKHSDDMVPLNIKYKFALDSTTTVQSLVEGKTKIVDQTVIRKRVVDVTKLRNTWMQHVATGFPGWDGKGITRDKEDVFTHICIEYLCGLEWIASYYFDCYGEPIRDDVVPIRLVTYDSNEIETSIPKTYIEFVDGLSLEQIEDLERNEREIRDHIREFLPERDLETYLTNDYQLYEGTDKMKNDILANHSVADTAILIFPCHTDEADTVFADQFSNTPFDYMKKLFDTDRVFKLYAIVHEKHPINIYPREPEIVKSFGVWKIMKWYNVHGLSNYRPRDNRLTALWYYPYQNAPTIEKLEQVLRKLVNGNKMKSVTDAVLYSTGRPDTDPMSLESLWTVSEKVQRMAVLPIQSSSLMPFQPTMDNPIAWQYPSKFNRDYFFRTRIHEGVVKLPPMDLEILAMSVQEKGL